MMKRILIVFSLWMYALGFSQKVSVSIDSVKKKIGSEFNLSIKTEASSNSKIKFPNAKYIGSFEVNTIYKTDTVTTNNAQTLTKKYGITQFEPGKYTIPKIPVLINGKTVYTKELRVEVLDVKVDTLKQKMYDIKDVTAAPRVINWWLIALIFFSVLIIASLIYWFIKNKNIKINEPEKVEIIPPLEKASQALIKLESKGLLDKDDAKSYYSELTNIARVYIEEVFNIPAMESTSAELIESLKAVVSQKKLNLSPEIISNFENVLMQSDLVKFAKVKPQRFEIENDKKTISNALISIQKAIPVQEEKVNELELWNEEQKEIARIEQLKKLKKKRIAYSIAAVVSILVITLTVIIASKGLEFVKESILGHPTKELLNSEWVTSEYGNPSIKIETPKVLVRTNDSINLSNKDKKVINDFQSFSYGSILGDYSIFLSTLSYKVPIPLNLDAVTEEIIKNFEKQGAKNILIKTQDYQSQKGFTGKKAFGTFSIKGSNERIVFQALLFSQQEGFQNLTIVHKENDEVAKEITERILNSVELKVDN